MLESFDLLGRRLAPGDDVRKKLAGVGNATHGLEGSSHGS
jgi:hypothetical protein